MRRAFAVLAAVAGVMLMSGAASAGHDRARHFVRRGEVAIEVIAEGRGPLIVLLPSRGRDSLDYDEVAADLAGAGYRVLRPQPRGIRESRGPLSGITLHDFAADVAAAIEHEQAGPAIIVGHAFGNWVARMTAVDHPALVRGVVLAAAAAKQYPPDLSESVGKAGDPSLPATERLKHIQRLFFAPGHDPSIWLEGWWPEANKAQHEAGRATRQEEWWSAGSAPLLDLQAALDPFKPPESRGELKEEFGDRVTIVVVPDASHALIPEQPRAVTEAIVAWAKTLP